MQSLEMQVGKYQKGMLAVIVMFAALLGVYWNLQYHDFINYDDPAYIAENYYVKKGLTWEGIKWAFGDIHTGYGHPLTWISHMMDYELFGLRSGGHHWTNLIFHILSALILFHLFRTMTGDFWKSGFVASLFAIHPLNVESVAWIAERKNVLSAFFWLASLWAYVLYDRKPTFLRYLNVLALFSAGLLAKPMVVTLPFVLLLIDFWPLRRSAGIDGISAEGPHRFRRTVWRLIIEKIPLFILSFVVSAVTLWAVRHEHGLVPLDLIPMGTRISHALVSYVDYLGKLFWPVELSVFYPHPMVVPLWKTIWCALMLVLITASCLIQRNQRPYLLMGWLWYLGVLFPVIGILQAGHQAMADRYAYLPFIGIFIMITWGGTAYLESLRRGKSIMVTVALSAIVFFSLCTWVQVQYWQDSVRLFRRALEVTSGNWVAHNNLGSALLKGGRLQEAMYHFQEALKIKPAGYPEALNNVGYVLAKQGRYEEAIDYFNQALRLKPDYKEAINNLGSALSQAGRIDEGIKRFREALLIDPEDAMTHNNMGIALSNLGRYETAARHFQEALRIERGLEEARKNLEYVQRKMRQ